jgi:hypothetical protein
LEVPVKLFDDCLDGLRYAVFKGGRMKKSLVLVGVKKDNGLSAFDGLMDRGNLDSCFRGFE